LATPTDTRLVLFAHGSGDSRWRAPFERLRDEVARRLGAERVRLAYMEFAPPTLLDVAAEAVRDQVLGLRLLPLFMAGGGHVDRDIPAQVAGVRQRFPELAVEVLPPVGDHPRFRTLLCEIAAASL
jgi:sirohydrochlorin cobaltochelatase